MKLYCNFQTYDNFPARGDYSISKIVYIIHISFVFPSSGGEPKQKIREQPRTPIDMSELSQTTRTINIINKVLKK